jgi:hypothetical protein
VDTRFKHEIEWYEYWYVAERCKVVICHKGLGVCNLVFYSKEKLEELVAKHKWNPFAQPIYQEALKYFPGGTNEIQVR